jgi:adenosylcobinamide kinase/adenosylcobinamide-phosphate guanylyltransferase
MLILISGGVRSGKSQLAEKLTRSMTPKNGKAYYFATGQVTDVEMEKRILKHQADRGEAFATCEVPYFKMADVVQVIDESDTVLFECLTFYVANVLFSENLENYTDSSLEGHISQIVETLFELSKSVHTLTIVTNDVFRSTYQSYSPETLMYLKVLAEVMKRIAKRADRVYEVMYGLERRLK